jgi:SAM-dependent methyltransferase
MGNTHQGRKIDGVGYTVRQDMIRTKKQTWTEKFVIGFIYTYVGLPVFSVLAPIWYLLTMNSLLARQLVSQVGYFLMPWLDEALVDVKHELLKDVHGRVLDVGSGSGCWLKYLGRADHVTALEPNEFHVKKLKETAQTFVNQNPHVNFIISQKYMHEFFPTQQYDYVIIGNVLCTVEDTDAFLRDIDRVLKPGGKVVFQEHIRAPPGHMVGWAQDLFNYWWKTASNGCQCNKDPAKYLRSVKGWQVEAWELNVGGPMFGVFNRIAVGIAKKSEHPHSVYQS